MTHDSIIKKHKRATPVTDSTSIMNKREEYPNMVILSLTGHREMSAI